MNSKELEQKIFDFVATSPLNQSLDKSYRYFDAPLIGYADLNDPIFQKFKEAISPEYLLPDEWLRLCGDDRLNQRGTVISWALPISKHVRESNRKEKSLPSEAWAHTRFFGENFNKALRTHVAEFLLENGFIACAPSDSDKWQRLNSQSVGIASNWSERHAAYAAGLGTFSLNDGLITACGIAHRVGSVGTASAV